MSHKEAFEVNKELANKLLQLLEDTFKEEDPLEVYVALAAIMLSFQEELGIELDIKATKEASEGFGGDDGITH